MKLSLTDPRECSRPISEWSIRELTDEIHLREIADISPRQVGRFLSETDIKPHKVDSWMNPKIDDPLEHNMQITELNQSYWDAPKLKDKGVHTISIDEKTGIQALERISEDKPMIPGYPRKIEYEYRRHGTLCLIPGFDVATGKIIDYFIGQTRTEEDFADIINKIISHDPDSGWIFIADQLNTHKSEALVKLVAKHIGCKESLGIKGKSGILKNKKTREQFLTNKTHRIRFIFTPKHCSWLNQVECWFSILTRKLLKRSSFTSKSALRKEMQDFIEYFNKTMAKPYQWTFKGKVLAT